MPTINFTIEPKKVDKPKNSFAQAIKAQKEEPIAYPVEQQTLLPDVSLNQQLQSWQPHVSAMLDRARHLSIVDRPSEQVALTFAVEAKRLCKTLNEVKTNITQPIKDQIAQINSAFSTLTSQLLEIDSLVKEKITDFQRGLEAEALDAEVTAAPELKAVKSAIGGGSYWRETIDYELIDIALVPVEFLKVDEAKVKAAIKAGLNIPGIKSKIEKKLVTKTR